MPDTNQPNAALFERLRAILGPRGLLTDPADTAPHVEDWRRLYRGRTAAVLRPADTAGHANQTSHHTDLLAEALWHQLEDGTVTHTQGEHGPDKGSQRHP